MQSADEAAPFAVHEVDIESLVAQFEAGWLAAELSHRVFLSLDAGNATRVRCFAITGAASSGSACLFPGDQVVLSEMDHGAAAALGGYLVTHEIDVPGIFGPQSAGNSLAEYFSRHGFTEYRAVKRIVHWELTDLPPAPVVGGVFRPASESELEAVIGMRRAMQDETNTQRPYDPGPAVRREFENGEVFVWVTADHGVVCTGTCKTGGSEVFGTVDGVFTRPELRGRGFATALVWHLAKTIFAMRDSVFLSSDADAQVPTRLYRGLRFTPNCEMVNIRRVG